MNILKMGAHKPKYWSCPNTIPNKWILLCNQNVYNANSLEFSTKDWYLIMILLKHNPLKHSKSKIHNSILAVIAQNNPHINDLGAKMKFLTRSRRKKVYRISEVHQFNSLNWKKQTTGKVHCIDQCGKRIHCKQNFRICDWIKSKCSSL